VSSKADAKPAPGGPVVVEDVRRDVHGRADRFSSLMPIPSPGTYQETRRHYGNCFRRQMMSRLGKTVLPTDRPLQSFCPRAA